VKGIKRAQKKKRWHSTPPENRKKKRKKGSIKDNKKFKMFKTERGKPRLRGKFYRREGIGGPSLKEEEKGPTKFANSGGSGAPNQKRDCLGKKSVCKQSRKEGAGGPDNEILTNRARKSSEWEERASNSDAAQRKRFFRPQKKH